MLRWCSYCQQFLGETPDFQKLAITHGICASCEPQALDSTESDLRFAKLLRDIHHRLYEAGRRDDLAAAEAIIETAYRSNVRAVDVLIGIVAPMLHQVGEDWRRNALSVAEEHRFTAYCNAIFKLVASRVGSAMRSKEPNVLLINAPGNSHRLAIRILSLWLRDKGIGVRMIEVPPPLEDLITLIVASEIRTILISMALAEQLKCVASIVERIVGLPPSIRPRVVVGGHAVKVGLISAIPGAELMRDISML